MEVREKTIKPSQKMLSFIRNEKQRGFETYIIHRSFSGMKEIRVKPLTEFEKQQDKTRLHDGVLDEDEFEDLDKVYEKMKKYIETKHNTQFKPSTEEVRKYMDAYLADKNKKVSKNAYNSYLNCKKIREEYMKNKIEKQQEKKRMRELQMKGMEIQVRKQEVELRERDKQLLQHYEQPYSLHPNPVNIKIKKFFDNKKLLKKSNQVLSKECSDLMKEQLAQIQRESQLIITSRHQRNRTEESPNKEDLNESFFMRTAVKSPQQQRLRSNTADNFYTTKSKIQNNLDISEADINIIDDKSYQSKQKQKGNSHMDLSFYNLAEKFKASDCEMSQAKDFISKNMTKEKLRQEQEQQFYEQLQCEEQSKYQRRSKSVQKYREQPVIPELKEASTTEQLSKQERKVQLDDIYIRKSMISMVTGKPIRPYLQLMSLKEKIKVKFENTKAKETIKLLDENKLKNMLEFKNFIFPTSAAPFAPSTHPNLSYSSNSNNNQSLLIANEIMTGTKTVNETPKNNMSNNNNNYYNRKSVITNQNRKKLSGNKQQLQLAIDASPKSRSRSGRTNSQFSDLTKRNNNLMHYNNNNNNKGQDSFSQCCTPDQIQEESQKEEEIELIIPKRRETLNRIKKEGDTLEKMSRKVSIKEDRIQRVEEFSRRETISQIDRQLTDPNTAKKKKSKDPIIPSSRTFSVNFNHGNFGGLVKRLELIKNRPSSHNSNWEKMRDLEEEMNNCDNVFVKKQLRSRQEMLGKRQFNILRDIQKKQEEERAIHFEKLVKKTEQLEGKLIDQFEGISLSKKKKNQEFKHLMDTQQRDRPLTRQIRKKYYDQGVEGEQKAKKKADEELHHVTLKQMRINAEDERKQMLGKNEKQVEWYQQAINKLSQFSSTEGDMTICHLLMDQAKQLLEDGQSLEIKNFENILIQIEYSNLQHNSNSLYCVQMIISLLSLSMSDLPHLPKFEAALNQYNKTLAEQKNK